MSELTDSQIAWRESQKGHWIGRASTRRSVAQDLRGTNDTAADKCLVVASEYEARAESLPA